LQAHINSDTMVKIQIRNHINGHNMTINDTNDTNDTNESKDQTEESE
jgi:hypothetical protein